MRRVQIIVPIYLPNLLHSLLRRARQLILERCGITTNIRGGRDVEYSWIATHMPEGPGEALDFGSRSSHMSLIAVRRGFRVIALDLEPQHFLWAHPNASFIQGDLLKMDLPLNHFDLVINCSSIEHVGLAGRFGVTQIARTQI